MSTAAAVQFWCKHDNLKYLCHFSHSPFTLFTLTLHSHSHSHSQSHQPKSAEELLRDLDDRFTEEKFDAIRHLMESLPDTLSEEYLQQQLSERDCAQDVIQAQLTSVVSENYESFGTLKSSTRLLSSHHHPFSTI
jgi:hypothetical protein